MYETQLLRLIHQSVQLAICAAQFWNCTCTICKVMT